MSIAAMKRRRKQFAIRNRHLAKIGRPGVPKKISTAKAEQRLAQLLQKQRKMAANKAKSKGK